MNNSGVMSVHTSTYIFHLQIIQQILIKFGIRGSTLNIVTPISLWYVLVHCNSYFSWSSKQTLWNFAEMVIM